MTEEIIGRFFRKECTAAEAAQVSEYLKSNPKVLNRYLGEREWENIQGEAGKSNEYWDEIWTGIEKRSSPKRKLIFMKRFAVAVTIGGLIFISYDLTVSKQDKMLPVLRAESTTLSRLRVEINTTATDRLVLLEDGSKVTLSPSSVIEYNSPFTKNKRDILLKGEALFKVAKDRQRPFTVFAGSLSTTALGTEFRITTWANREDVTVKLFAGKVVIKSTKPKLEGWSKNVYLLPREQVQYNAEKKLVFVGKIETATTQIAGTKPNRHPNKKQRSSDEDVLSFSSTALDNVIDKLSTWYQYRIVYDSAELSGMNFTGVIAKTDSLPVILKVITQMNHLEMQQKDDQVFISRPASADEKK